MNYYEKFKQDMVDSGIYEIYVKNLFQEQGWGFVRYNNDKFFDILMTDKRGNEKKIEVKKDCQTGKGNIIFEFSSYGKPSGIKTSQSDFWVYVFPLLEEIWFIKTPQLKKIIEVYNPEKLPESPDTWTWVNGGDGQNSKCYLWNRKVLARLLGKDLKIIKRYDIPE
jgi:hypothetical protein